MTPTREAVIAALGSALVVVGAMQTALAQEEIPKPSAGITPLPEAVLPQFPSTYGPLDAGRDAYLHGEAQRREAIGRQIQLGSDLACYYGQPGYGSYVPGLEAAYAGPRWRPPPILGPVRAYRYGPVYPVFEPWPFVPGDIYGAPYFGWVPQPLGHEVIRTGPNGYVYRPVYGSDLEPNRAATPAVRTPAPPAPELSRAWPQGGQPQPEREPAPNADAGPREF